MERVCFQLQVKPQKIAEYVQRHDDIWPDMQRALRESGWCNFSLFMGEDGLLTGYLECDNFEDARNAMQEYEVNTRWQEEMAPFFEGLDGTHPDQGLRRIPEVFHLDCFH